MYFAWLVSAIGHLQKQSEYYIRLRQVKLSLQFIEHQIWRHNIRTNAGVDQFDYRIAPLINWGWLYPLFIPFGYIVFRRDIQKSYICSIKMRKMRKAFGSISFSILSIMVNLLCSWNESPGFWKCFAASMLSEFFTSLRYCAIRKWNGVSDFQTYCISHFEHSRR